MGGTKMTKNDKILDTAIFAGGCFWCMVEPFDTLPGIKKVVSGYTGGHVPNPTYQEVCTGKTGHTEAVEITFDPKIMPYKKLVALYWQVADPTDAMGQFQDRGDQYRPVIYYNSEEQKKIAEESKKELAKSGIFDKPIVTKIEKAGPFYPAEEYHQDFYKKDPLRYQLEESGGRSEYQKMWKK
ncbi:MAG: peptide-methionine (S)-S-oxide reductase MsrA [Lactobacillus sp.]|nr:peptide-methionine (S)-S-oxide reductase MsrA [Lactobacillus sp.]